MSAKQLHVKNREIRRAFGDGASEILKAHEARLDAIEGVLMRGFWAFLWWLVRKR